MADVLLLDYAFPDPLGSTLRSILEPEAGCRFRLRKEVLTEAPDDISISLDRYDPAVVFLILSRMHVKQPAPLLEASSRILRGHSFIVVTREAEPADILRLLELGAEDFVTSPLGPADVLPRLWRLLDRLARPGKQVEGWNQTALRRLLGQSPAFLEQINRIPVVARCDVAVLISGETGTGKELVARAIHEMSPRASGQFVPVNCGAIPVDLVESEMFGHVRGAYTSAGTAQQGLVREAEGGTLFLDEIDSLPLLAQVKLLRFLQEKEYRPLGSPKAMHGNVRIITATNIDVEEGVRAGRIRRDLYYRLNILPIALPPLRDRTEDIPLLASHFCMHYARQFAKPVRGFTEAACEKLLLYRWPGNVRELENAVARAVALTGSGLVDAPDLSLAGHGESGPEPFQFAKDKVVKEFERTYLEGLLIVCHGNISRAAKVARKNRRAFWELLRKHHIDTNRFRQEALPGKLQSA
ncbi:MAG: sigma-54 dependent transcriptional regulator [Bryobacteraceae bacterium]|nr:sigma-54 dependent transcriptional regulator [Bryobacteraceae bacterium]